jgi:hypothetical protein
MKDEQLRNWKEIAVAYSRHYSGNCLKGLSKIIRNLSQESHCPLRDTNQAHSNKSQKRYHYVTPFDAMACVIALQTLLLHSLLRLPLFYSYLIIILSIVQRFCMGLKLGP